jgi:hypothetical protein
MSHMTVHVSVCVLSCPYSSTSISVNTRNIGNEAVIKG